MEINRNEAATIGATASVVSVEKDNANVKRKVIVLQNTSTGGQTITISVDKEAVANEGVVLSVGGVWQDSQDGEYMPTQKVITAISSAVGGQLSIYERCE